MRTVRTLWSAVSRPLDSVAGSLSRLYSVLPIAIVGVWWLLCFAFYVSGWPIQYNRGNVGLVALLFSTTLVLVVSAFVLVAWKKPLEPRHAFESEPTPQLPWAIIVAVVAVVALYPFLAEAYSGYSFWEVIPALANQSGAYELASLRIQEGTSSRLVLVAVQTILSPLTLAALPFLALRWFDSRRHLVALLIVLGIAVFTSILGGRDFQLVLSALLVAVAWITSRIRRGVGFRRIDLIALGGAGAVGVLLFGLRKQSRMLDRPYCPEGADVCAIPNAPTLWDTITVTVSSYLSQGFEGLGRALDATWVFGGGFSHSPALTGLAKTLFGFKNDKVVTAQLDSLDWSATANWSTGFAMIANDVPWVLVPLVVAANSLLLAFAWRATVVRADWLSMAVFSYTFVSLFFMPMNLQLAISGPLYLGYIALVVLFVGRAIMQKIRSSSAKQDTEKASSDVVWKLGGRPVL